jgi:hypothetical protein
LQTKLIARENMNKKNFITAAAILILLVCAIETNAQRRNKAPQTRFGVRAGFNMSDLTSAKGLDVYNGLAFYNQNMDYVGFTDTKPFKYGYSFGITSQIQLSDSWFLQPSLIFTSKGYKLNTQNLGNEWQNVELDCQAYYVQVPVDVVWKYELSDDWRFLTQAGAYIGFGVAGTTYFNDHYGEKTVPRPLHEQTPQPSVANNYIGYDYSIHGLSTTDYDATFETDGTNVIDLGAELGIGFEYKSVQIMLNYQYSFTPLYDYNHDFSARYLQKGIKGVNTSFDYLKQSVPSSPTQYVISLTFSYYFDFLSNKMKF